MSDVSPASTNDGVTIWLTGLPGAGKSTLAAGIRDALLTRGRLVEVLDGDAIRQRFSPGLTFSKADRDLNVRRIGRMALDLSQRGVVAIVAAVSPYRDARNEVRRAHGASFVEVYVECPVPELIRRDPKGLYAKALKGEIEHFTGISDPYEPPLAPEITVHTDRATPEQSQFEVLAGLSRCGVLTSAPAETFSGRSTISVVVPTRNRHDSLHRLLCALSKQDRLPDEVIVVDASDVAPDVAALRAFYPLLPISLLHTAPSVCAQRNAGIRRARGTHVLLCDDDIEPPPDYIRRLSHFLQSEPSVGAASGIWSEPIVSEALVAADTVVAQGFSPANDVHDRIIEYRAPSVRSLVFAFLFQLTVWGDTEATRGSWLTAMPLALLKRWYRRRGNTWSLAGWPLVTQVRMPVMRTAVYSLGAALVQRDWLLASPYDERLSAHGIGDNYGVALGFPGERSIAVLTDLVVRHHRVAENRLDAATTYSQRLMALDYFMHTTGRFSLVNRLWLHWSLVGHTIAFAMSGRRDLFRAAFRGIGTIADLSHARPSP